MSSVAKPPDSRNLVRPLTTSRRSPFAWAFSDREGNLRTTLLIGLVMGVVVVLALGTYAALLAANAGSPGTLALWVTAAFLFIKIPLLIVVWWIISRRRDPAGGGGWESRECREILAYLETQARDAAGRPDAARAPGLLRPRGLVRGRPRGRRRQGRRGGDRGHARRPGRVGGARTAGRAGFRTPPPGN